MTYSQYLELFEGIGVNLGKTHDISVMDETVRKFFLNFTIEATGKGQNQGYQITHLLKKPWSDFVSSQDFVRGRQSDTAVEPFYFRCTKPC